MRRIAGYLLMAIALAHFVFGLLSYFGPFSAMARVGFWNSVDPYDDRQEAFWFAVFAVPLFFLGQILFRSQISEESVLTSLGWQILAVALIGAFLMPISGFWLVVVPALLLLWRRGADSRGVSANRAAPAGFEEPR